MYSRRGDIFSTRKKVHWFRWVLLFLLVLIIGITLYAVFDNGNVAVKTQRIVVWDLPKDLEGFTILHISDLNGKRFGTNQKQLENALSSRKYSAVCITGNMVGPDNDPYPFYELLGVLDSTKPVYFIAGDSDPLPVRARAGELNVLSDWVLGAQSRRATYVEVPTPLTIGKATVWFSDASQLSLDLDTAASAYAASSTDVSSHYWQVIEDTRFARERVGDEDLHIALAPKPLSQNAVQQMSNVLDENGRSFIRTVDVVLAGGTAGGQWRLPFVGPVWSGGWFPDDDMLSGYHNTGIVWQSITGGLGTDANSPLPDFRLFNTPEVTLITFTSEPE